MLPRLRAGLEDTSPFNCIARTVMACRRMGTDATIIR